MGLLPPVIAAPMTRDRSSVGEVISGAGLNGVALEEENVDEPPAALEVGIYRDAVHSTLTFAEQVGRRFQLGTTLQISSPPLLPSVVK